MVPRHRLQVRAPRAQMQHRRVLPVLRAILRIAEKTAPYSTNFEAATPFCYRNSCNTGARRTCCVAPLARSCDRLGEDSWQPAAVGWPACRADAGHLAAVASTTLFSEATDARLSTRPTTTAACSS